MFQMMPSFPSLGKLDKKRRDANRRIIFAKFEQSYVKAYTATNNLI